MPATARWCSGFPKANSASPCWERTSDLNESYVTDLEPALNYPNPAPFERSRGANRPLEPGESYVAETTLEVLDTSPAVSPSSPKSPPCNALGRRRSTPKPVASFIQEP